MRFLTIVPGTLLVGFAERPGHHGEPETFLQLQLTAIGNGQLNRAPDDLGVPVAYEINVGVEVPVQVLDAVEFGPVPPSSNRAVACEYRQLRRRVSSAPEVPADQAIVAEVLQPQTEA